MEATVDNLSLRTLSIKYKLKTTNNNGGAGTTISGMIK